MGLDSTISPSNQWQQLFILYFSYIVISGMLCEFSHTVNNLLCWLFIQCHFQRFVHIMSTLFHAESLSHSIDCHSLFNYLSTEGHLGMSQFRASTSKAAMNSNLEVPP